MMKEACLTVALVVQVEATGSDGVLTLHYGDEFDRTWEVGEPAKDSGLEMDVVEFVSRREASSSRREASEARMCSGRSCAVAHPQGLTASPLVWLSRNDVGP